MVFHFKARSVIYSAFHHALKTNFEATHAAVLKKARTLRTADFRAVTKPVSSTLPPFSLLRDFSFQNTAEHFAIRFRQSYLIWKVCDVTAIELSSKE